MKKYRKCPALVITQKNNSIVIAVTVCLLLMRKMMWEQLMEVGWVYLVLVLLFNTFSCREDIWKHRRTLMKYAKRPKNYETRVMAL